MLSQLDAAIARYVGDLPQRRSWREVNCWSHDMGALRDYVAGNLFMRIVDDRGISELDLGSVADPSRLFVVSLYRDLLAPPMRGHWNLGLEDQARFVDENWDALQALLAPDRYEATLGRIDAIACRPDARA